MSNGTVQDLWKIHWKNKSTLEDSGSIIGNRLRQKRFQIVKKLLNQLDHSSTILDMGCGGGSSMKVIKDAGFKHVFGIDFTEESMRRCESVGFVCDEDVFLMDAKKTRFCDNSFDVVFSEGLWEHFKDPRAYMIEACRLSKKYILVIQPNHFSFFGKLMNVGWNLFEQNKGGIKEYSFPISYFVEFLKMYGFYLVESKSTIFDEQKVLLFKKVFYSYKINGLNIKMYIEKPYKQLEPYRISYAENYDLIFHVGQVPKKVNNNSIYSSYRHKLSNWELKLHNFKQGQTTVHFKGDPLFSRHLFFTMIFEPLIQYKQAQNNKLVLHASAVEKDGKAYVFVGDANIGKTSTLINFLSKNYNYIADDQVTVNTKNCEVYPYPLPIGVNIKLAIKTRLKLSFKNKISLLFQTVVNSLFVNYTHLTTNIEPDELIFGGNQAGIGKASKLDKLFILKNGALEIKRLTANEAYNVLWDDKHGSQSKLPALIYYGQEFKKKNKSFNLWSNYQILLDGLVNKVSVYQVSFTKDRFDEALNLMEKTIEDETVVGEYTKGDIEGVDSTEA